MATGTMLTADVIRQAYKDMWREKIDPNQLQRGLERMAMSPTFVQRNTVAGATAAPATVTGSRGKGMIMSRLRYSEGDRIPFDFLEVVQMSNRVMVFIAHNDQALQLEDGLDLFPSDQLITQLRLIMSPKPK